MALRRGAKLPLPAVAPFPTIPLRSPLSVRAMLISALQACACQSDFITGKKIHARMLSCGLQSSPFSITSLINFYSKCGRSKDAIAIFRAADDPSLFAWNAVISGMVINGFAKDALGLYREMRELGIMPDMFTYPCVINACSDMMEAGEARKVHGGLFKAGLESDVFVSSALVNCYIKFGFMVEAERLFEELLERDVVLWNSMVNGFAQTCHYEKALEFFERMIREGVFPSKFTITGITSVFSATGDFVNGITIHGFAMKCAYDADATISNSLIDMYGKCGNAEDALKIFEAMPLKDNFSWNSIISVLQQEGDHVGTLSLFGRMMTAGIQPDPVTISAVVPACSQASALIHGREIHKFIIVTDLRSSDVFMENAIMDMYAKCGKLDYARSVFDMMEIRDTASWNIMISGYAAHGQAEEALGLFSSMCEFGIAADVITFVGVLSACSHAGLVDKGKDILCCMEEDYEVTPTMEHYSCVVDMLGRAGRLEEAHDLLISMPKGANAVMWRAYMAACHVHGDKDRTVEAANCLIEMEPEHSGSYVLLSNIYGSTGKFEEVSELRSSMKSRNVTKVPGCSWIELVSGLHSFITGDKNHKESDEIYSILSVLVGQLRMFGYVPKTLQGE